MSKFNNAEIKAFEFSDLKGTHVVSSTQFQSFSFKDLKGEVFNADKPSDDLIRQERGYEQKNNFKIDGVVRDLRGISKQEQTDQEKKIEIEVRKRLETAYQEAYLEGLEKGRLEGEARAFTEFQEEMQLKVVEFEDVILQVKAQTTGLIEQNKTEVYEFIKRFSKWILMKEINEKVYLEALLEKLILELNARKNLTIKIGQSSFKDMPDVIKTVEAKLGQLQNVRVEVVPEIVHPGIILESENGLIDGSLEGVFQNIDRIFEQVVGHESIT
jgi:flagellar assembly protein FliH